MRWPGLILPGNSNVLLSSLHQIYSSLRGKGGAFASMIKHISIVQLNQTGEGILYLYKLAIKGATCKRLTETSTLSGNLFPFSTFYCSTKQWNQCFYLEGKLCECEKKNQTHCELHMKDKDMWTSSFSSQCTVYILSWNDLPLCISLSSWV